MPNFKVSSGSFGRLLLAAGAVGVIGVTVELTQGPPAIALPVQASYDAAPAPVLSIDHSVVKNLGEDFHLEPGASVAAYGS